MVDRLESVFLFYFLTSTKFTLLPRDKGIFSQILCLTNKTCPLKFEGALAAGLKLYYALCESRIGTELSTVSSD